MGSLSDTAIGVIGSDSNFSHFLIDTIKSLSCFCCDVIIDDRSGMMMLYLIRKVAKLDPVRHRYTLDGTLSFSSLPPHL